MSEIKYLVFLVMVYGCATLSCNQCSINAIEEHNPNDSLIVQRYYYDNGRLKAERTCKLINGDTVIHGYMRLFYPSGQLKVEISYEHGNKEGIEKGYFENKMLSHLGLYKDGKQDSLWVWYYNDEKAVKRTKQAVDFWKNGKPLSHQLKFDSSGNEMIYLYYDPIGRPIYKREFNQGGYYREEGSKHPLIVMVNEKNNEFHKGDTLRARFYYIKPPRTEAKVFVRIKGLQNEWSEKEALNYYTPVIFEHALHKIGTFKLEVKLKLRDERNSDKLEFISHVQFNVR